MSPYRGAIAHHRLTQAGAAGLVSSQLTSAGDVATIAALLDVAAGISVAPRALTMHQYELLAAHRVLSLIPADWSTPPGLELPAAKRRNAAEQLLLAAEAKRVVQRLTEDNVDVRVLKGIATGDLDYPYPAMRTSGDVDLLVRPQEFERAITTIEDLGFTRPPPGRYGYVFQQEATLTGSTSVEIDLHFRLTRTADAPRALFDDAVALKDCGGFAMPADLRLMHAASHLFFTAPGLRRISGLADISAIRSTQAVDLRQVREHASSMGCEAIVGTALSIERSIRGLRSDTDDWAGPSWLEKASFLRPNRHMLLEHVLCARAVPSWPGRARYVADWAFPNAGERSKRGGLGPYFQRVLPRRLGGQTGDQEI